MPWTISSLTLMQVTPGKPWVSCGAERALNRLKVDAATALSWAVVMPMRAGVHFSAIVSATTLQLAAVRQDRRRTRSTSQLATDVANSVDRFVVSKATASSAINVTGNATTGACTHASLTGSGIGANAM